MTINTTLTPEERAVAPEALVKALEQPDNPVGKAWLAAWRKRQSMSEEAIAQAEEIHREISIAMQNPGQRHIDHLCGFPTDMTRCSPFFPMKQNDLGQRRFLMDYVITSANWGEIRYTGPQLSTYEEDALLVLLAVLNKQSKYRKVSHVYETRTKYDCDSGSYKGELHVHHEEIEGYTRKTYTYNGPMLPLLKLLGIKKPGETNYTRLLRSLELLTVSGVKISVCTGKTKSGKRRAPRISQMCAMLAGVSWDDKSKELTATINPFFYETYMAGRITLMDVTKRMSINGSIAKALYRFVQSQRNNPVFSGYFLTLADALNMDKEQPAKELRRLLKTAIGELVRQGVLLEKSGFVDQDIIRLHRAPEALPDSKPKKHKN